MSSPAHDMSTTVAINTKCSFERIGLFSFLPPPRLFRLAPCPRPHSIADRNAVSTAAILMSQVGGGQILHHFRVGPSNAPSPLITAHSVRTSMYELDGLLPWHLSSLAAWRFRVYTAFGSRRLPSTIVPRTHDGYRVTKRSQLRLPIRLQVGCASL